MSTPRHPNHRPADWLPVELRRTSVPAAARARITRTTGHSSQSRPKRGLDALGFAGGHNLAVPHVVAADITGCDIGDSIPTILMTFLRGRALASPDPIRLAETAATVHAVDPSGFAHLRMGNSRRTKPQRRHSVLSREP
jgi:hypothetical protein